MQTTSNASSLSMCTYPPPPDCFAQLPYLHGSIPSCRMSCKVAPSHILPTDTLTGIKEIAGRLGLSNYHCPRSKLQIGGNDGWERT